MFAREKLFLARTKAGKSRPWLAKELGVSDQTIWRIESGRTKRVDEEFIERALSILSEAMKDAA